ncbi:MAG: site-specific integrase [Acidobacteria bacterium]|nr:site-specific integrase [Acidobacteriota bacterium]
MSVRVRPYRRGGFEVDILALLPDGTRIRDRRRAPVASRSAALRWGQARERELIRNGRPKQREEVPTLADFAPRFLDGYARANRQKPSGIAAKETALRVHLIPALGNKPLDRIGNEDVQRVKTALSDRSPKTVNNVLTVLNTLLKVAVEWGIVERMPCTVRLLRVTQGRAGFHDFHEYERLIEAARAVDSNALVVVLLGGEAGLRCGEMMALEWTDVDTTRRQLQVERSEWKGKVTVPKGGRSRIVPMTSRLAAALTAHRHLRGPRVLCQPDGQSLTQKMVRVLVQKAARRAQLKNQSVHILRHTFCSHLAMRGAPARAIQELAGHKDLSTTQRYMHLSPAAIESAIRLLDRSTQHRGTGDGVETGSAEKHNQSPHK